VRGIDVIYSRVSTAYESQEESLDIKTATLKQVVAYNPKWKLYHIYTEQDSGGNVFRPGFQKTIFDCYENRINIVLVKTISRIHAKKYYPSIDRLDSWNGIKRARQLVCLFRLTPCINFRIW
jgi:DNA invertase Pin-like site-specific DNA recombinase